MRVYVVLVEEWDIESPSLFLDNIYTEQSLAEARVGEINSLASSRCATLQNPDPNATKENYFPHPYKNQPDWEREHGVDLRGGEAWFEERELL